MNTVIVDYGMGNLQSLKGALHFLGCSDVQVSADAEAILSADKLILPGVGNFHQAMRAIRNKELDNVLRAAAEDGQAILGICLGMQLLGNSSTEGKPTEGLGLIPGVVDHFADSDLPVPHVGFNQVTFQSDSRLYRGLASGADFYFTHSFAMQAEADIGQAHCDYIAPFVASFELDHIAGVQFHPELSQANGLQLIENFLEAF